MSAWTREAAMAVHTSAALDEDAVWAVTDSERSSLADLLEDLSPAEWERPSLCAGWRVRDVAAHLTLAQIGPARAAVELLRAGGSSPRMIRDTARRHAAVPPARLVGEIRAMAGSRRHPPVVSHLEPMVDVLVHGQDVAVPLGRPRTMPVEAAAAAATRVWTMTWPLSTAFHTRRRLRGLHLVASDTDWSAGEGARVEGPVEALLLLLTGRTAVAVPRLSGPGVDQLAG
jgi:uncharacterized protein (TIGR03083 family)